MDFSTLPQLVKASFRMHKPQDVEVLDFSRNECLESVWITEGAVNEVLLPNEDAVLNYVTE